MSTWKDIKTEELKAEIKSHKGMGTSQGFKDLKIQITDKLGAKEWERVLRKAQFADNPPRKNKF